MSRKYLIVVGVLACILLYAVPTFAVPGVFQVVSVMEGDVVHTYLLDTESGSVWEMKTFKTGEMANPYFIQIPKFDKDKALIKWQDELTAPKSK